MQIIKNQQKIIEVLTKEVIIRKEAKIKIMDYNYFLIKINFFFNTL